MDMNVSSLFGRTYEIRFWKKGKKFELEFHE